MLCLDDSVIPVANCVEQDLRCFVRCWQSLRRIRISCHMVAEAQLLGEVIVGRVS